MQLVGLYLWVVSVYVFLALVAMFVMAIKSKADNNDDFLACFVLSIFWLPILLAIVYVRKVK